MNSRAGVTLVEILVALAIAAVALAAIYGFVLSTTRSFGVTEGAIEAQQTARFVTDRIVEEARWAEEVAPDGRCPPTYLCPDRVTLRIPPANPLRPGMSYEVTFFHDGRQETAVRQQGRGQEVIGEKVALLRFRYLTAEGHPAVGAQDAARIDLEVTARPRPGGQERTIQTELLLRNLRLGSGEPPPAPPLPPAFRPAPSPPAALNPRTRPSPSPPPGVQPPRPGAPPAAAPAPAPAAPGLPPCPPAPEPLVRRPPPRPEVSGALVALAGWELTRAPSGALTIETDVENHETRPVIGVRISATGYGTAGNVVASASAAVSEVAEGDFETFRITLPPGPPALWIILKVEQYVPRPSAPLHAVLVEVPLELYEEVARQRVVVTATILPTGPAARQVACVAITDPGGLPIASARVTVEVAAVGQRTVTQTVEVAAGKTVSIPLVWNRPALPGAVVRVEDVLLAR